MTFPLSKFLPVLLFMPVLFALSGAAQEPEDRKTQKPESMGVATGTPHAPVRDALSRPITAGGFVDGSPDLYVANYGKNRLYHNNHDGTFTDVAEKAGVTLGGWSTGPTWGDYDHDGLLDLFVPGYVKFDADHPPIAGQGGIPASACQFRGVAVM